jgi:VPDSG-CTERM motif
MYKLKYLAAVLIGIVGLGLSTQSVQAVAFSNLNLGNPGIFPAHQPSYGVVGITVVDSIHATVTFLSASHGGETFLFGGAQGFDLNVNSTNFTASGFTGSRLGIPTHGFTPNYFSVNAVDGWGSFNLQIDAFDGFGNASDHFTFTLTNLAGNPWTTPGSVLNIGTTGFDAAAHVFVATTDPVTGLYVNQGDTGFAAEDINGVINPVIVPPGVPDSGSTLMMLGGALGLIGMARRYLKS